VLRRMSRTACRPSPRAGPSSAQAPRSRGERRRELRDPARAPLRRRQGRRIDRDGLGEPQIAFEPVEARSHDRAEGQIRVRRAVDRFDLQVRFGAAVPRIPVTKRRPASRFSSPQHVHGPDQRCG
jgi:hypothetical protein